MIPEWNVKLIQVGVFHDMDKSGLTHFENKGVELEAPMWMLAIYNDEHKVLVDTGIHDVQWVRDHVEPTADTIDGKYTVELLKEALGWEPEDVDTIISTHLHYDHCGAHSEFKNAIVYVQQKEWDAAHDPTPTEARFYCDGLYNKNAVKYFRWRFLDGDTEIYPGLAVITTPGHTRGHQSVLINTSEGVLCSGGDIVNIVENVNGNYEPGIVVDGEAVFDSLQRIRDFATHIQPGHEPSLKNCMTSGFPLITGPEK